MIKRILIIFITFYIMQSCQPVTQSQTNNIIDVEYPETVKTDHVDNYHGTEISDPYNWLEIDTAADVEAWVIEQNKSTNAYLEQIPFRKAIRDRYEDLFNYPKLGSPFKAGEHYFFYKNDGLQNQSVIYIQKGLDGEPEVFMDPNEMSEDGTAAVNLLGFSGDNKYVAYAINQAGSDWQQIKVKEIETKQDLNDELNWVKFSGASWKNDGFYYSRYPAPAEGTELSAANEYHALYYHKLGDDQSEDTYIFGNKDEPLMYHFAGVTEDKKYLIASATTGTDGFETWYKDLDDPNAEMIAMFRGFSNKSSVIDHKDGRFLVLTDIDAPKYRLVSIDLQNQDKSEWVEIIPESDFLIKRC